MLSKNSISKFDIRSGYFMACKNDKVKIVRFFVEVFKHGEILQKDEY